MKRRIEIIIALVLCCVSMIYSQSFSLEDILEDIYNESVEVFEQILSYSENRKKFMFHFVYDKNEEL